MSGSSTPLWSATELKKAAHGWWFKKPKAKNWDQIRVSYDIRGLAPRNLVVCKHPSTWGPNSPDTSKALAEIAAGGAAGAIVQENQLDGLPALPPTFPVLVVKDTFKALRNMAEFSRRRFEGKVVAITGTVGKTTSREMLLHLFERQGGGVATRANNNNLAGVMRTMAYVHRELAGAAIEMGFGHPRTAIGTSSEIVRPHVGLITSVSTAHLDVFPPELLATKSGEELVTEFKSRIFNGIVEGGAAVIHRGMPYFETSKRYAEERGVRLLSFGDADDASTQLLSAELEATGSRVRARFGDREIEYTLQVPGRHMVMNSLGVLTAMDAAGFSLEKSAADIGEFAAVAGRSRVVEIPFRGGRAMLIDDHFNATPASMDSTLALLKMATPDPGGRRIAALGEIGHLGPDEARIHADLAQLVDKHDVDMLFTWGPLMRHMFNSTPESKRGRHCETVPELYAAVREYMKAGDVLTVKSGRGQGGLGDKRFRQFVRALGEDKEALVIT